MSVPALPDEKAKPATSSDYAKACGLILDPWQEHVGNSTARRQLLLCSRQSGKSTIAGLRADTEACSEPNSLVLLVSPTQRQSSDLFRTCLQLLRKMDDSVVVPEIVAESALRLELANGSRIIALPGSEATVRGYAACSLCIIDEAARVPDDVLAGVLPTLATTNGRLIALSTPRGKRGWFYLEYASGSRDWERTTITADECPRITPEFLDGMKKLLGPRRFDEEFYCLFHDPQSAVFNSEMVAACFTSSFPPLFG